MLEEPLVTLGKKGAFYRSPRKRAVAENLPRRLRGHSGVSPDRATEPHHRFDKKTKFQTGDSGLGPETPAYRKIAETAKRKLQ